jgi:N-acetylmuramic acid 6-phosphate etherase
MKAGTAQKLILNSVTTATLIQLGHVKGNKMVDMQLTNEKLTGRAERIVMGVLDVSLSVAQDLLQKHKSVRKAIDAYQKV